MADLLQDAPGRVAWMIVDRDESIRAHSHALRSLISASDDSLVGLSFGEASRCINALVENSRCGQTTRCGGCALHRAVGRARREQRPCGPDVLQRTSIIDGHLVERAYRFFAHPREEPGWVLVTFDQQASERALWSLAQQADSQAELPRELLACG